VKFARSKIRNAVYYYPSLKEGTSKHLVQMKVATKAANSTVYSDTSANEDNSFRNHIR